MALNQAVFLYKQMWKLLQHDIKYFSYCIVFDIASQFWVCHDWQIEVLSEKIDALKAVNKYNYHFYVF